MEKKYQVFVSSTYEDLKEERLAVISALLDNDCIPVGMEQFPASGLGVMDYIEKSLRNCDYYILLLAGRYGSEDKDGIGFTEKEYNYAKKHGISILVFYVKSPESLPISKCEETDAGRKKLNEFRKKVLSASIAKGYSSVDDLRAQVVTSINRAKIDTPAEGWVRASTLSKGQIADEHLHTLDDTLVFETSGSFVSTRMHKAENPLYLDEHRVVKLSISADKDYLISVTDSADNPLKLGYIPNMAFFPTQIIPSQFPLNHKSLHISTNGAIVWNISGKLCILQLVQTGEAIVEYEGRYAIYSVKDILGDKSVSLTALNSEVQRLKKELASKPNIHFGKTPPAELKTGDLFFEIE